MQATQGLSAPVSTSASTFGQQTREEWLNECVDRLRPLFALHGATIPRNIKISCGFPFGRRGITSLNAIGQAWPAALSTGDQIELFISPVLDDGARVADVLAHECVHAAVDNDKGHGPAFKHLAEAIGLTGKMTATVAGDPFKHWFNATGIGLGKYPHHKLVVIREPNDAPKFGPDGPALPTPRIPGGAIIYRPQATRLVKVSCPHCEAESTPYIARMSRGTLASHGAPICPKHNAPMGCAKAEA